jgi:hypothetical protein
MTMTEQNSTPSNGSRTTTDWPDEPPPPVVEANGEYLEAWDALRYVVLANDPWDSHAMKALVDAVAIVVQAREAIRHVKMASD